MIEYMDTAVRIVIGLGYILIVHMFWVEGKEIIAEWKKDDIKEKNSAEETAE